MNWHREGEAGEEQNLEGNGIFAPGFIPGSMRSLGMHAVAAQGGGPAGTRGPVVADPEGDPVPTGITLTIPAAGNSVDVIITQLADGKVSIKGPGIGEVTLNSRQEADQYLKGELPPGSLPDGGDGETSQELSDGGYMPAVDESEEADVFREDRTTESGIRLSDHGVATGRAKMMWDRDQVINDGARLLERTMSKFGGVARPESIVCTGVNVDTVQNGHIINGELNWNVRLHSYKFGKGRTVGLKMVIRNGKFEEPSRLELTGGVTIPITKEAVTRLLEVGSGHKLIPGMDAMPQENISYNSYI